MEALDPLHPWLYDTDENAGSKRDPQLPGCGDHREALLRPLVGRPMVGHSRLTQSLTHVLEHQPEAHVDSAKPSHLLTAEQAGVGMRQQAVLERALAGKVEKLDGASLAEFCNRPAVGRKGALGSIPQTEQRFSTALRLRAFQPRLDLIGAHRPLAILTRRTAKRPVIPSAAPKIPKPQESFQRQPPS